MGRRSVLGLVLLAMVLGLLLVVGILVVLPGLASRPLPTLLAMPPTDTKLPPTQIPASATSSPTATVTVSPSSSPTQTATSVASSTTQDLAISNTNTPETTVTPLASSTEPTETTVPSSSPIAVTATTGPDSASPTSQPPTQGPTAAQPTQAPTVAQPTKVSTQSVSPTPSLTATTSGPPTITPTFSAAQGVPLQTLVNVPNVGDMMVVSAAFPATVTMSNMGVTAPPPPAGSAWLLVEALMKCAPNTNCSPAPASLIVRGASAQTYSPTTAFTIDPRFGPEGFTSGQVWGYLEFAIPTSEQQLRLVFVQGSDSYTFALQ